MTVRGAAPLAPVALRLLEDARVPLRLACVGASGWPVIVSLWYLLEDGELWCATPAEAAIVGLLRASPRCGVEVSTNLPPYRGIRLRASASLVEARGDEILERLVQRYLGRTDSPFARWLLGRGVRETAIRLAPVSAQQWDFRERMAGSLPLLL